jgi:S1-C subfamily serine protease
MAGWTAPRALRTLTLLALATLLAIGAFSAGWAGATRSASSRRTTSVTDAVRHAAPAVVSVFAETRAQRGYWKQSSGAGVLVHPSGYVITNSHVIEGGQKLRVELFRGEGTYSARVVVNAPRNDLALLRIERSKPFRYVSVADSREALLGESVIAVGNPHGLGDTITVGVVSALGRDAKLSSGVSLQGLIQTDASINTGNSGGALLNLDGELLGVIVSLLPRSTGIAFAIPGEQVRSLLQRALGMTPASKPLPDGAAQAARPTGRVSSARQAVPAEPAPRSLPSPRVSEAPPRSAASGSAPLHPADFGMSLRQSGGWMRVRSVSASGAAGLAGIREGDLILSIDGRPVESELDMILAFSTARPGRVYQLEVLRSGRERLANLVTPH